MRLGVVNGNGCSCSICHEILEPKEAIKIKSMRLHSDLEKAATGCYEALGRIDCCKHCYDLYFANLMEPLRKRK